MSGQSGSAPPRGSFEPGKQSNLTPDEARLVEAVAARVAELIHPGVEQMLTAAEVAELLRVDRAWVYRHREALGAVRLGDGPNAPVRFPASALAKYLAAGRASRRPEEPTQPAAKPKARRRRSGANGASRPLLRYSGDGGGS